MSQPCGSQIGRRTKLRAVVLASVVVAAGIIGTGVAPSASSTVRSSSGGAKPGAPGVVPPAPSTAPSSGADREAGDRDDVARDDAVTEDDGVLPRGVTVFDDRYPGIANLDPDLLRALRVATKAAADEGIRLTVNSGWRSRDYQDLLLREATVRYGSRIEAARWVATGDTSPHVSGDAVDIGSTDGSAWLTAHGPTYGLCRIYRNEPWHFELRPQLVGRCPRMYADPAHDPRMRP